ARAQGDPAWIVRDCALGDREGTAELRLAGATADSSSLLSVLPETAALVPQMAQAASSTVRVERLDAHAAALSLRERRTLLKIDVQGAEDAVLRGAGAALGDMVAIYTELSVVPLYQGQRLMHEIVTDLRARGFRLVDIEPYMIDPRDACLLQVNATFVRDDVALDPILQSLVDEPCAEPRP
ncbi:MAG: FkbM family methyltransferase, partial [Alphaproteobacteria bacterium]|nr:FkbM family methyltransferase [Alphaproteobacteria bacterium]